MQRDIVELLAINFIAVNNLAYMYRFFRLLCWL